MLPACRTEDGTWNVLDSVYVTVAKGAPAGELGYDVIMLSTLSFRSEPAYSRLQSRVDLP
jgi:hypothetical protein